MRELFARTPRRAEPQRLPEPVPHDDGLFVVDATWGTIRPMTLAPGVRTIAELEVIDHLEASGVLVDSRRAEAYRAGSIDGAVNIPHPDTVARMAELDPARPAVFFCNGPQCAATPNAIAALLDAGFPPSSILYYRGGLHDWLTLGLPVREPLDD